MTGNNGNMKTSSTVGYRRIHKIGSITKDTELKIFLGS